MFARRECSSNALFGLGIHGLTVVFTFVYSICEEM
jgi:hypothetical protein